MKKVAFAVPALLQKLLQAMQNPAAPKGAAVTYAFFTLVAWLADSQFDVMGLWFGRRAYERSRGEMITMLYEKTLSRKMVSASVPKREASGTPEDEVEHDKRDSFNGSSKLWYRVRFFFTSPFQSLGISSRNTPEVNQKEPASMGKILNLMR